MMISWCYSFKTISSLSSLLFLPSFFTPWWLLVLVSQFLSINFFSLQYCFYRGIIMIFLSEQLNKNIYTNSSAAKFLSGIIWLFLWIKHVWVDPELYCFLIILEDPPEKYVCSWLLGCRDLYLSQKCLSRILV